MNQDTLLPLTTINSDGRLGGGRCSGNESAAEIYVFGRWFERSILYRKTLKERGYNAVHAVHLGRDGTGTRDGNVDAGRD